MQQNDPQRYLDCIAQAIFDRKGINILALDLRGVSSLTDYVIIAEGNVDKHVLAIAHAVIEELEKLGVKPVYVDGMRHGDWVVIDYLHFMVHLFMPGVRDRYHLEQLWKEGKILNVNIRSFAQP